MSCSQNRLMTDRLKEPLAAPPLTGDAGMSVVICCHNGKARIGATLEALAKCSASFSIEILLVDSGSNDGTSDGIDKTCFWLALERELEPRIKASWQRNNR
jgi:hypothetical protein